MGSCVYVWALGSGERAVSAYKVHTGLFGNTLVVRIDDDGGIWWLGDGEQDAGYLTWLAEGNTPEEWNPDNIDNGAE